MIDSPATHTNISAENSPNLIKKINLALFDSENSHTDTDTLTYPSSGTSFLNKIESTDDDESPEIKTSQNNLHINVEPPIKITSLETD